MRAALLYGPGDIRVKDVPAPEPGPGEALVRIRAVGVCASDLHFYRHGEIGGWGFTEPALLGHECAGEIVGFGPGPGSGSLEVGTLVAIEPTRPCGECDLCRSGRYNICRRLRFAGQPPDPGAFCEYATAPINRLFALPSCLTFAEGAMVEPLAVAVHAVRLAGVSAGSCVAVVGGGAIGLSLMQVSLAYGAKVIVLSEPLDHRRQLALRLGCTAVVQPEAESLDEVTARLTGGAGADVAFEASGCQEGPALAARCVGSGGTLCLVGIPDVDELLFKASLVRRKEMTLRTVRRYCGEFPESVALLASGRVKVDAYTTHHFPLEQTGMAFEAAVRRPEEVVRAVVDIP